MKKHSITEYADILYEVSKGHNVEDVSKIVHTYARFLKKRKMLGKLDSILTKFEKIASGQQKIVYAKLVTPEKISESHEKEIVRIFKKEVGADDVEVDTKIDKSLIAGWKIKTNEYLIDASLSGRINRFRQALTK